MYEKIKLITKNGNRTQYLKPEESFIISIDEWKKIQSKQINREDVKLITEPEELSKEYHKYLIEQLQPEKHT